MKPGQIVYQGTTKKGNPIIVRYPKADDVIQMTEYINSLSSEQTFITFQGEQQTLAQEREYLDVQLEKIQKGDAVVLLVFCQDKLIALSDVVRKKKIEQHVGLFGITVAKPFRNEGIGKSLINLIFKETKKRLKDLKIITLGCFANNTLALQMYKKLGFQEYGNLPKGIKYKNNYIDHIYMYKSL